MRQILHIFRKDSRMFWPEILITLVVTAAFVAVIPTEWRPQARLGSDPLGLLRNTMSFLVPLCWFLLIARVVHAESLVGENRAWLPRPYEWEKLLAAKILFIAAYVCLPLLIAQCILLHIAAFPVISSVPGLLYDLGLITAFLLLPLFALATVTANFARMTLTLLGVLLFLALFLFVQTQRPRVAQPFVAYASGGTDIGWLLWLAIFVAAILLQYTARRLTLARLLLIATIIASFTPGSVAIDPVYPAPAPGAAAAIQLAFSPDAKHMVLAHAYPQSKQISVEIPVSVSGIPDGIAEELDDVKFSIDGPAAFHWESPWQSMQGAKLLPTSHRSAVSVEISPELFDRLKSKPIDLHMTFAVTRLQAGRATRLPVAEREFAVPYFGICSTQGEIARNDLLCRAPLHQPTLTHLSVVWSEAPCLAIPAAPVAEGDAWIGEVDPRRADFGLSPISMIDNYINSEIRDGEESPHRLHLALCPGTPITFTQYGVVGRTRAGLTLLTFQLPGAATPY